MLKKKLNLFKSYQLFKSQLFLNKNEEFVNIYVQSYLPYRTFFFSFIFIIQYFFWMYECSYLKCNEIPTGVILISLQISAILCTLLSELCGSLAFKIILVHFNFDDKKDHFKKCLYKKTENFEKSTNIFFKIWTWVREVWKKISQKYWMKSFLGYCTFLNNFRAECKEGIILGNPHKLLVLKFNFFFWFFCSFQYRTTFRSKYIFKLK